MIVAGGGIHLSSAYESLSTLAELAGLPVATTISGKGSLSETHPLSLGICGRFSRYANDVLADSDLLLVVGSKLGEIATNRWAAIPSTTTIIYVDIDPAELGKVYKTELGIWADARTALDALISLLSPYRKQLAERRRKREAELLAARKHWLDASAEARQSNETPVCMARLLHDLRTQLPPEAIIVADGGFASHWSAAPLRSYSGRENVCCKPR